MKTYDVIIIGAGTGGHRLAVRCAKQGKNTAVIEPSILGGTCLNWGCIPTKAMLHASGHYAHLKELSELGITTKPTLNFKKLLGRVQGIIKEGQGHIQKAKKLKHLTIIKGKAVFTGKQTICVGKQEIKGKKIIISSGASHFIPPVKGLQETGFITNKEAIYLKKLPKELLVIGGGYISMEFATFFSQLGCKVTVLERLPTILAMLDKDIVEELVSIYEQKGIKILTNVNIVEVSKKGKKKKIIYNDVRDPKSKKKSFTADDIFCSTGLVPNTKGMQLEQAGVKTTPRGHPLINDYLETSNKNIFAIGDVTGKAMFAHAVKRETAVILDRLKGKKTKMNFSLMPWAAFTHPPVAGVGLAEKDAPKAGVTKAYFRNCGRAKIINEDHGFVKIVYDKKSKKILGSFIVGPHADDLIHEFIALMQKNGTLNDVQNIIHIHPTLAEVNEQL